MKIFVFNMQLTDIKRIESVKEFLGFNNLSELAKATGIKVQTFYDIQAERCKISNKVAAKIQQYNTKISLPWLLTGEGSMLKSDGNSGQVIGYNSGTAINGDGARVTQSGRDEVMTRLERSEKQNAELLEQNSRLLRIIENLTSK